MTENIFEPGTGILIKHRCVAHLYCSNLIQLLTAITHFND